MLLVRATCIRIEELYLVSSLVFRLRGETSREL